MVRNKKPLLCLIKRRNNLEEGVRLTNETYRNSTAVQQHTPMILNLNRKLERRARRAMAPFSIRRRSARQMWSCITREKYPVMCALGIGAALPKRQGDDSARNNKINVRDHQFLSRVQVGHTRPVHRFITHMRSSSGWPKTKQKRRRSIGQFVTSLSRASASAMSSRSERSTNQYITTMPHAVRNRRTARGGRGH